MTLRFAHKTAWITGGGTGLGRAMAIELARQGAFVALSGRRHDRLEEVAATIAAQGGRALAVACDVRDPDAVAKTIKVVIDAFKKLDIAVANAGFAVSGRICELAPDDWRRQFDTNVFGLINTTRYALPYLHQTNGRMVLLGSIASFLPTVGLGPYNASKYAVRSIGETLAAELYGTGVTCTTIHPGLVASEIHLVDNLGRLNPTNRDRRPSFLLWDTEAAARVMVHAIYKRKRAFTFTRHGRLGAFFGRHIPLLTHHLIGIRAAAKNRRKLAAALAATTARPVRAPPMPTEASPQDAPSQGTSSQQTRTLADKAL